jgi:phosphate-selective porin
VEPNAPFDFGGGHWGAWGLVLRWSSLNVDPKAFRRGFADPSESARHADALGTAIAWYLNDHLSVLLHYEHTMFGGGDGSGDRDDEDAILTRMQLVF